MKTTKMTGLAIAVALSTALGARGQLTITELMQSNITYCMDDLNDFPDSWVELYNAGDETEQLGDYHIGLKKKIASADALPAMEIMPGEYVIINCDKAATGLHTSFRLESNKAGDVYLFKNGEQIDHVAHPIFPAPNIAYGLDPQTGEWGYEFTATPGAPNIAGTCDETRILPAPSFSAPGRIGTEPLTLMLSMPDGTPDEAKIRYTLDGSLPTAESDVFEAGDELTIDQTICVRAGIFCEGWLSTFPTTHSYIFPDHEISIPVVSIVTDDYYLYDENIGIFNDGVSETPNWQNDWRRPINIELFEPAQEDAVFNQLGETRIMGGYSRLYKQKSLTVYANKRFGIKRYDTSTIWPDKPNVTISQSFILRNGGNDFEQAHIRDGFVQTLFGRNIDNLDWQAYRPTVCYINGRYAGIYGFRERSNEDYVAANYDGEEDIDMAENWAEVKAGSIATLNTLVTTIESANPTLEEVGEMMDVDNFLKNLAIQMFAGNTDYLLNNIVWWRVTDGGKWRLLLKDVDRFMTKTYVKTDYFKYIEDAYENAYSDWHARRINVFRYFLTNPESSSHLIDMLTAYMGDFLAPDNALELLEEMAGEIQPEIPYHGDVYFSSSYPTYWSQQVSETLPLLYRTRYEYLYENIAEYYDLGQPRQLTVVQPGLERSAGNPTVSLEVNGQSIHNESFNGKYFQGRRLTVAATPLIPDYAVSSWIVRAHDGENVSTSYAAGNVLDMDMPECDSLEIEPVLAKETTGIESITVSDSEGKYKMYDLTGREVDANGHIRPGIYITTDGSKATKRIFR